jgi:hypothetical protein
MPWIVELPPMPLGPICPPVIGLPGKDLSTSWSDYPGINNPGAKQAVLDEMKNNPPRDPNFKAPKKGDGKKKKNPNGSGSGWPDKDGDVWVPTDHGDSRHSPHWDIQDPTTGKHTPQYPDIGLYKDVIDAYLAALMKAIIECKKAFDEIQHGPGGNPDADYDQNGVPDNNEA